MQSIDRRKFLGIVGAGSAAAAAAAAGAAPAVSLLTRGPGKLSFRAETGLPGHPWPAYATAVVEGSVDLESGTGLVGTRIVAGQPGNQGDIGLPGTARLVRITKATTSGSQVHMQGVVEDRSTLARGESARRSFVLDRATKQLRTELSGTQVSLPLV